MPNGNGTTKWLIGLGITAALALGGWTFGATQAARARLLEETQKTTAKTADIAIANERRISVLESEFRGIRESLKEIKEILKEHEARSP